MIGKDESKSSSEGIYDGDINKDLNPLIEKIIGFLFRKLEIDRESIQTLKEYSEKGNIIYASFNSSNISLLILYILLKKNQFTPPAFALEYNPFLLQTFRDLLKRGLRFFNRIFLRKKYQDILDTDYIENLIREKRVILLSLLSRKFFLRRYMEIKHDSIIHLIEIQKKIDTPIYLMPEMIFWNMNPERTKSFMASRAVGDRGFISAWLTNLKCVTPSFVRILEPINLKQEIEDSRVEESHQIAIKVRNRLLEIYHYEKRTVLGPVLKSQQEMMERVLYHRNVLDKIKEVSTEDNIPEKKLRKQAYKYYKEIAADFSIVTIRFFKALVEYMFKKIFDGFSYDPESLKLIKETAQKGPIVLAPSHKSHMDYLIVSYLFYANKMAPPHIAAGVNLSFFPLGTLFRRSGAFFIRRTFRGLKLYPVVFKQYVKTLISEGYAIEFFIEGGRTRTGKLVIPKLGFLNYLIEAIEEGYNKDLYFIPISVNYDRILEEASFQEELRGREKTTESTSALVESRKLLRRKYGKVYITFNKPFSLKEIREEYGDVSKLPPIVANKIINKIYDVTVVTPFAITTTTILLLSVKGFSKRMLEDKIINLYDYLVFSHVMLSDSLLRKKNIETIVDYVIESYLDDHIIEEISLEEAGTEEKLEDFYTLKEENRTRIGFYKNSIIHYFMPLAYYSLVLLDMSRAGSHIDKDTLETGYRYIKDLFLREFMLSDDGEAEMRTSDRIYEFMVYEKLLIVEGDRILINADRREVLQFYGKIVREYLESYLIVLKALLPVKRESINRRDFIKDVRKRGIRMFHLGEVQLAESLSLSNYNNAVSKLADYDILREEGAGTKDSELRIVDQSKAQELSDRIREYLEIIA
jgi:glycerol-3-phosphate O-acyltransferase